MNKVLHAFGTKYARANFFGHPFRHPLTDAYFSQCPIRFGDYVAKLGVFPASLDQDALTDWRLDPQQDDDNFRHASTNYFYSHDAVFEVRAPLWTDPETQPIEDASVDWPADHAGYVTAATIRLPRQQAYGPERMRYFDEVMTFRPRTAWPRTARSVR